MPLDLAAAREKFLGMTFVQGECLIWARAVSSTGYGNFYLKEWGQEGAHRAAWRLFVGDIPAGLYVLHGPCNNRRCVRVAHLGLGTQKDNMQDSSREGTRWNARKMQCPRGHSYVASSWVGSGNWRRCLDCAAISARIRSGWNPEMAVSTPIRNARRKSA